jgi:hypothetical protein
VDPVPDPLLLRKSGSAGNRTRDRTEKAHAAHSGPETAKNEFLVPDRATGSSEGQWLQYFSN